MKSFGASAPGATCFEHFGFTIDNIKSTVGKVTSYYSGGAVPALMPNF
jgi:transketolase